MQPAPVLISDGKLLEHNLTALGRDRTWLNKQLARRNCRDIRRIFLLLADDAEQFYLVRKDGRDAG